MESLEIDLECNALSGHLVADGVVPSGYAKYAVHIAIASVHGVQSMLIWKFKRINNPETRARIRASTKNACEPRVLRPQRYNVVLNNTKGDAE